MKFPCTKCGRPVDITDMWLREMSVRQGWRTRNGGNPSMTCLEEDHPILEACHEGCDTNRGESPRGTWFRWKRCNVPGCCVPLPVPKSKGIDVTHLDKIYDEIKEERMRQDNKWGGASHDDEHIYADWFDFIVRHTTKSLEDDGILFRKQMVRVAALAVAAIEWCDRRTLKYDRKHQ
jgi:hypothetical protein